MSRDIRSFFTKTSPSCQKNSSCSSLDIGKKHTNKKRANVISDSDSDEDLKFVSPKRSKSSIKGKVNNYKGKEKDDSKTVSKSKYFPVESVKVSEVFGNGPIKRDNSRKIIKKTILHEEKEFHLDKDFESELLKLDNDADIFQQSLPVEHCQKVTASSSKKNSILPALLCSPEKKKRYSDISSNSCAVSRKKLKLDSENTNVKVENSFKKDKRSIIKVVDFQSSKQPEDFKSDYKTNFPPRKSCKTFPTTSPAPVICVPSTENELKTKKDSPPKKKLFGSSPVKYKISKSKEELKYSVVKNHCVSIDHKKETNDKTKAAVKESPEPLTSPEIKKVGSEDVSKISGLPSNLWVEKYKPVTSKQIIGQQGEKSCVSKLKIWLQNWPKNQSSGKKLAKPSPWAKNDDGAYFKAALLSGPPGVGKTTTAHLVCKELGLDVVEFNASDTRSKKSLQQEVSELLSSSSLSDYCKAGDPHEEKRVSQRHVLLMDEVDGMAGNEDRGGVQQLIALVKLARVPIVCMCNDRNHPKIRSLANHCFDLRFSKPRAEQIRGAMMSVCFKEKIKITPDALTEVIMSANQDIRLTLNHLSMLSVENTNISNGSKHIKLGPWDITRKIFSEEEHKAMSLNDKCDLFFHDYSVTPLFVQENYLNAVPHKPEVKNKIRKMELFARAARSISYGDLTERRIRSHNAWGLLPVQAIFSSYIPGEVLEGHLGAQISFPAWFGKNSRQNKMNRLVQELTVHSRLKISGNREAMNLDYLDPLESHILGPLMVGGAEGVAATLAALSEYTLVREDIESLSELCTWPNAVSRFSRVDSKVKAAFTRAYNKANVVTPYVAASIRKTSREDTDADLMMGEGGEGEGEIQEGDEEEGDDDGLQSDAMIVVKKKAASKKSDREDKPFSSKGNKNPKRGRKK